VAPLGSIPYSSPELLQQKPYVGPEVDVWSMGVTLYVLSSNSSNSTSAGTLPFGGKTKDEVVKNVFSSSYPKWPSHLSTELRDLLSRMLERDPKARITIDQIKQHPWVLGDASSFTIPTLTSSPTLTPPPSPSSSTILEPANNSSSSSNNSNGVLAKCSLAKVVQRNNSKGKLIFKGLVQRMHKALSNQ